MARILKVAQLGAPVIREKAKMVTDIQDPKIQALIDDMLVTVADEGGMGIAAPQVYASLRIVVICSRPNARYPYAPMMEPTVMINPEVLWQSDDMVSDWEGCLTIPGVRGLVPRHVKVRVRYQDREGAWHEAEYDDFVARIFQHEVDHLEGIVYLDRMKSTRDMMMEKEWRLMIAETRS